MSLVHRLVQFSIVQWFLDLKPYTIWPSSPFAGIEVGDVFEESDGLWRLLEHDAVKVRVVKLNWWTKLWWGGQINGKSL
jgi:hypothetical protein